ncbi:MAG: TIGR00282 family metallophosphoesterase [Acholeplasmataceae bacterium]|nr:TIGR00282 family metallophosphoesterase [Acholeplasmataceae bacterium]MDD4203906.1 TIGR00282 family metallophosphoesterase [Acholeplasmataceae bacterium]MDD4469094.1 TIGR00282 family metallophosphoesterase [Acholeplasmataceae bacterium]MDD4823835.1 TIGR00282 family metallophosphoesterase [Acholeplasmataceae bacterium]
MKILFVGDIYGEAGRNYFKENLPFLKETYKPNLIIVNAENSANNGRGITDKFYKELMEMGVSSITMGNHVWGQKSLADYIDSAHICRPANYNDAPGKQYDLINYNGKTLMVMNFLGRTFMDANLDNPFTLAKKLIETVKPDYSFIDFHAEATSEKIAFGHYLDGIASVIVGTHTHVPTADERSLPKGTLYISDVGMTGPLNGIIGVKREIVINRFLNGFTRPNEVEEGKRQLNAVMVDLNQNSINRIHIEE